MAAPLLQRSKPAQFPVSGKLTSMDDLQTEVAQLREASRQVARQLGFLDSRYRKTGFTQSQCHVLVELEARRRLTVGELADILIQDISSTSRTIRSLINQELIQVFTDSNDGRRRQLQLTAAGRSKAQDIQAVGQSRAALELLNPAERAIVVQGMSIFAQALTRSNKLSEIEIRNIVPQDNEMMSTVIRQVMSEFGAVGSGMSIGDAEVDEMSHAYGEELSAYFVGIKDKELLGGAGIAPLTGHHTDDICELRKMYILPSGRGIGLGHKLMNRCMETAIELGYKQIYLETLDNMLHARHLFEKVGFRYLDGPLGQTGHHGCSIWAVRDL